MKVVKRRMMPRMGKKRKTKKTKSKSKGKRKRTY